MKYIFPCGKHSLYFVRKLPDILYCHVHLNIYYLCRGRVVTKFTNLYPPPLPCIIFNWYITMQDKICKRKGYGKHLRISVDYHNVYKKQYFIWGMLVLVQNYWNSLFAYGRGGTTEKRILIGVPILWHITDRLLINVHREPQMCVLQINTCT